MSPTHRDRRLTVAMIVRDAAEALDETLCSVRDIADEIVVVDTGSTDATVDAARRHAARLVEHAWEDDFGAARNHAAPAATGDWLLWLDAGETMSPESARGLREFLDNEADTSKAYMLLVQVPSAGANAPAEQIGRVRLVPNTDVIRFRGRVRESVAQSLLERQIGLEGLPYRIARGLRDHDPQTKAGKARRNIRLAELEMSGCGRQLRLLNCLGEAHQTLGDNRRSSEYFRLALEESEEESSNMLEAYYGLLTSLDGDETNRDAQLSLCLESLEVFPLDIQLLCAMGAYLQAQSRMDLAARAYLTAYQYGTVNPEVWHLQDVREVAAACHSLTLQLQKKDDEARDFLREALAANEHSLRLRRQLMELEVKHGRRDEALLQLEAVAGQTPHVEAVRSAIRGACLVHQQNWTPALAYLEAAYQAGCRDPICLRWFTIALASTGEAARARSVLEEWRRLDPSAVEVQNRLAAAPTGDQRRLRVDSALSPSPASLRLKPSPSRSAASDLSPPPT